MAWRREKAGVKRDPGKAAYMTLTLETRSLGVVSVQMRVLGQGLSLVFGVADTEAQAFINQELPELVERLTGRKFRLNAVTCETHDDGVDEGAPARPVRPTSSLDLKA